MSAFELLSVLLDYPRVEPGSPDGTEVPEGARRFLRSCAGTPLAELQARYVETFDFDRRASLHLTYHSHGDRRQRGIELVRLKRRFRDAGLALADGELPDYLPALLEFAALAPEGEGASLLAELRPQLELVRSRLHERDSPYAHLLDAVVAGLPGLTRAQAERVRRLAEQGPPGELVGLEPLPQPEPVA